MKKRILVIVVIFIVALLFSCKQNVTENDVLAICSSFAVPGMNISDMKGSPYTVNVIEKDSYGRILFEHESINTICSSMRKVYVICQKYNENYIYYYEDICYIFDNGNVDLTLLKEQNDWNCPLEESKLSERKYGVSLDYHLINYTVLDWNTVRESYCSSENVDDSELNDFFLLDCDPVGNELCYAKHIDGTNYYVFVDTNYKISVLEDFGDDNFSVLVKFKKENNWEYRIVE